VEHQVAELAQVALLRRHLVGPGPTLLGRVYRRPPAVQVGFDTLRQRLRFDVLVDLDLLVARHSREVARHRYRAGAQTAQMLGQPRQETTDERYEQQDVDRGEPAAGEDVE